MTLSSLILLLGSAILGAAATPEIKLPAPVLSGSPKIDDPRSVAVTERSVVPVYVCQLQQTLLVLPKDELTRNTYVADSDNWIAQTTKAGEASRFLSVRVKVPIMHETVLDVITDHDSSYTFKLILSTDHCDSKVFVDPDSQLAAQIAATRPWLSPDAADHMKAQMDQAKADAAAAETKANSDVATFRSGYQQELHFDYVFDKAIAKKMGVEQIYRDKQFMYVKSHAQKAPTLLELVAGKPTLIPFHINDKGEYATDRIIDDGYLAVGGTGNGKHQLKLDFHRENEEN